MARPRHSQLEQWIIDALIGKLETAEVGADREPRLQIQVRAHRLFGVHVLFAFEVPGRVCADGQKSEIHDAEPSPDSVKMAPVAGVAGK